MNSASFIALVLEEKRRGESIYEFCTVSVFFGNPLYLPCYSDLDFRNKKKKSHVQFSIPELTVKAFISQESEGNIPSGWGTGQLGWMPASGNHYGQAKALLAEYQLGKWYFSFCFTILLSSKQMKQKLMADSALRCLLLEVRVGGKLLLISIKIAFVFIQGRVGFGI